MVKVPGYMVGTFGAIMAAFVLLVALPLNELFMYSAYVMYIAQDVNPKSKLNHKNMMLSSLVGPILNLILPLVFGLNWVEIGIYVVLELQFQRFPQLWLVFNELFVDV